MLNEQAQALGAQRSAIRELFEYGCRRAAQIGAENVLDFSIGNPSIPTPPQVEEAIREILAESDPLSIHGYTTAIGDLATRQAIADDLNSRYDAGVRPEEIFLCCGATPALTAAFGGLFVEGAEIVAIAPYFPEYKPFADHAGLDFRVIAPDIPNFQIDLAALEAAINPHTQAVIINSPNNPSGVVYTRETLEQLGDLLAGKSREFGHPIYIVSDEPYRELAYGCEVPFIPTIYPNTVVCYSYSKSLSMPGERIGYVYVPGQATDSKKLYNAIAGAARSMGHVCAPSLWQKVIARCAHLRPDVAAYDRNRQMLYEALTEMGYEMARPDGAFYLFIKAPGGDAMAFSEKAKQKDLLLVPGDAFGCPGYFRICYCVSAERIQRGLPVFRALMED